MEDAALPQNNYPNFSTCAVESNSKTKNLQESCIFLHDPFFSHIVG